MCWYDITVAVTDCFQQFNWQQCVYDILGAGNPCAECVCTIIDDVCGIIGCDNHC